MPAPPRLLALTQRPCRKKPHISRYGRLRKPPLQRRKDRLTDSARLRPHFMGPKADDGIACILHEPVTIPIIGAARMLAAVEFNDKTFLSAGEVREIRSKGKLPYEFIAAEIAVLQFVPEAAFGKVFAMSESSRAFRSARLAAAAGFTGSSHHNGLCLFSFSRLTCLPRDRLFPFRGGEEGRQTKPTASRKTSAWRWP